jgi:predicted lipoprotein with Yx(FWY)xxD motif
MARPIESFCWQSLAAACLALGLGSGTVSAAPPAVPASLSAPLIAPPGVTFQQTRTGGSPIQAPAISTVLADRDGKPLYVYAQDQSGNSSCLDSCAAVHPPFVADTGAQPQGDWSIIARQDGVRQWALRGSPVYRAPASGHSAADADSWRTIPLDLGGEFRRPVGIGLRAIDAAAGLVLIDRRGSPLYAFAGDAWADKSACLSETCPRRWKPLTAPQLGQPVGEFSVVSHNGIHQWAYQGRPLFTFEGDLDPGEVAGAAADSRWQPVTLGRFFMPEGVVVARNHFDGPILATTEGKTLYFRDRPNYSQGHSLRVGTRPGGGNGKLLGTKSCEGDCLKDWRPLAAPADAQPGGHWSVVDRPEGGRQWAYHSFPVYTYAGDQRPGDMNGYDQFVILEPGVLPPQQVASPLQPRGVDGLVWRAVAP